MFKVIDKIFRKYYLAGFTITIINANNEFKPLMNNFKDHMDVTMDCSDPGGRVPAIYRNKRTVKEICRSQYHRLPFQNIPKVMIIYLDFEAVKE